ncbi:hypothetical protein R1sor_010520 [Riccia sorocarpa]|uniref:Uncharacterized protein n=1 Tax=Riccia sorocarpa TaxID=122646 RepID=A0ABD3I071_9MARC
MAKELMNAKIPVTLILDAAVANMMGQVDMVLEAYRTCILHPKRPQVSVLKMHVRFNSYSAPKVLLRVGGVINYIGTFQTALVARSMSKPVYVASESYKFARLFPLDQMDMSPTIRNSQGLLHSPVRTEN